MRMWRCRFMWPSRVLSLAFGALAAFIWKLSRRRARYGLLRESTPQQSTLTHVSPAAVSATSSTGSSPAPVVLSVTESVPVHVISLARLKAARAAALRRVADAGLTCVSVFDAVDGRALSAAELQRRDVHLYSDWRIPGSSFRFFDRELKWGEVGCALSHVGVWERIAAQDRVALVLEDDVEFAPKFASRMRAALDEVDALVENGTIKPPDAMYLTRKAMRPEHDKLLPRSERSDVPTVRLLIPGFSYKTTAYLLW